MAGQRRPGQRRPRTKTVTKGPMHAVPCPFCGKKLDFRGHADASHGAAGWGETLERGANVDCDYCKRTSRIHTISQVTIIKLVQA